MAFKVPPSHASHARDQRPPPHPGLHPAGTGTLRCPHTTQMAPSPPKPIQLHSMAPGFLSHRAEFPESTCPRRGGRQQGQHTPLSRAAGTRASSGGPQATA